ncbi:MAG: FtsX-like permease family protein [Candidatus Eisenbacteria bacterium]
MRFRTIVWREMFERRAQLLTSLLAILLGISMIVAIRNITFFSEKAVARELDTLGANILILPKSATVADYFSADLEGDEFPEEYVTVLATSDLEGLDNLSPKLSTPVTIGGREFVLTGILPKDEFQAKAMWKGAGVFGRPEGCGDVGAVPGFLRPPARETLVRDRVIENLEEDEALVGAEVAGLAGLREGDTVDLLGKRFTVTAVLPLTGTVDDSRVFAHLHTVQALTGREGVVNAIEIVGCCKEISGGLVGKINRLPPDAKVVTVAQVVKTQMDTNAMMSRLSRVFIIIMILVGGTTIANYMFGNVYERRREIGTLMAMGADSSLILRTFLLKALLLGAAGGIAGYVLGTGLAIVLGPRIAGIPVLPLPGLVIYAVLLSVAVSLLASYLPARRAAHLDPSTALQEI